MSNDDTEVVAAAGFTVFCEDIRNEVEGRHTYVGVFAGAVGVATFPIVIPKFAVAVTYRQPRSFAPTAVELRVIYEPIDHEPAILLNAVIDVEAAVRDIPDAEGPWIMASCQIVMSPLQLPGPGVMKVRAYREGGEEIRLGAIEFKQEKQVTAPLEGDPHKFSAEEQQVPTQ